MSRPGTLWAVIAVLASGPAPDAVGQTVDAVYAKNCSVCHQPEGRGVPGQFPRLAGRVGQMTGSAEGRAYVLAVLLNGMAGAVEVDGRRIFGVMPPFIRLADGEIATVLSDLAALGDGGPAITPDMVAAARDQPRLPAAEVNRRRAALVAAGVVP